MVRVALAQKHVGLIEKKQSVPVISKLKDNRKLLLKLCCIAAQIPSGYLQTSAQKSSISKRNTHGIERSLEMLRQCFSSQRLANPRRSTGTCVSGLGKYS